MTDAEHLARRVETEEPSEELRDAVNAFMGWESAGDGWLWRRGNESRTWSSMPDPYHRLHDAATMMPAEWSLTIYEIAPAGWAVTAYHKPKHVSVYAQAPTEPRARTAAAIRAKGMVCVRFPAGAERLIWCGKR